MYTDAGMWSQIRLSVLSGRQSIREASRIWGISRNTVRKMARSATPPEPFKRTSVPNSTEHRIAEQLSQMPTLLKNKMLTMVDVHNRLRTELGYQCSYSTVRRAVREIQPQDSIWAAALDHISALQ